MYVLKTQKLTLLYATLLQKVDIPFLAPLAKLHQEKK